MAVELAPLPSNILTTKQYEEQQAKLFEKEAELDRNAFLQLFTCLLYTSPSPRDRQKSRMPSSA